MEHKSTEVQQFKSCPVARFKVLDAAQGIAELIPSVFNNWDYANQCVLPGFFANSLKKKLPKGVWGHDWNRPIAKTLEAKELLPGDELLPDELKDLGGLYIKAQFNLDTQDGKEMFSHLQFGSVDEFSFGYFVEKSRKAGNERPGGEYLVEGYAPEWSPVLMGCNDSTTLLSTKDRFAAMLGTAHDMEAIKKVAQQIIAMAKDSDPAVDPEADAITDEDLKSICGASSLPLAPRTTKWSASAARDRVREKTGATEKPNGSMAKAFVVCDGEKSDFGSYKLPHADVIDDELKTVPKAVFAIAAALSGARGGAKLSEEDRSGATSWVNKQYKRMAKEFDDDSLVSPLEEGGKGLWTLGGEFIDTKAFEARFKGGMLGCVEEQVCISALYTLFDALMYRVVYNVLYYNDDDMAMADQVEMLGMALQEFSAKAIAIITAVMALDTDDTEEGSVAVKQAAEFIKAMTPEEGTSASLRVGEAFARQIETALAAVKHCATRARELNALRVKDNRRLSEEKREQLSAMVVELESVLKETVPPVSKSIIETLNLQSMEFEAEMIMSSI